MKIVLNREVASVFKDATGIDVLPLSPYSRLAAPVSSHADMLACIIGDRLFSYSDYIDSNPEIYEYAAECGYTVVRCSPPTSSRYPDDVGLNVGVVGKKLFCNVKSTAKEIKHYAEGNGYSLIDVKQGYAACTTLILDDNNVVTGDPSIRRAMDKEGISVLFIKEDAILLPGYEKGFIGGASFVVDKKVFFFGNAKKLKEYEKISALIRSLDMEEFSISSGDVVDFGGGKAIIGQ